MVRKQVKPNPLAVEEIKTWHNHPAKCECPVCLKVKEYYGRDLELEEIMSRYEDVQPVSDS